MTDIPIEVTPFNSTKIKVSPDRAVAKLDQQPTLRWVPQGNLEIQYIGFSSPVGPLGDIEIPHEDSKNPGEWIAANANRSKELYSYTVYARAEDGSVLSSDPQIENEGTSGGG